MKVSLGSVSPYANLHTERNRAPSAEKESDQNKLLSMLEDFCNEANEQQIIESSDSNNNNNVSDEEDSSGNIIMLVNPIERLWLSPKAYTRYNSTAYTYFADTSSSYSWLVKLVADVCCTTTKDLIEHLINIERTLVRSAE